MSAGQRILVVEDQKLVSADLEGTLETLGYRVVGTASSGEEAVQRAAELSPDLVLMDVHLRGEVDGIEAATQIHAREDMPIVYLTAYADEATIARAKATGAFGYVVKPFNDRELRAAIEIAVEKRASDRMLAEERARRRAAELEQQRSMLLAQLGLALGSSLDAGEILQRVARLPVPMLGDACIIFLRAASGQLQQVAEAAHPFDDVAQLRVLRDVRPPKHALEMLENILASGRATRFQDFAACLTREAPEGSRWGDVMRALGAKAVIVVPILDRSSAIGAMVLVDKTTPNRSTTDVSLAEDIGQRVGLALDNVRLYREAQETAQTFRLLIEGVNEYAIFKIDREGCITTWNTGAERIEGYAASEVVGKSVSLFYPPEEIKRDRPAQVLRTASKEGRAEYEGWCVRKDASRFWANVVVSPLRDETGYLLGFAEVTRDLSERKRAEDAQRFLDQATIALASSLDLPETLERAAQFAVPELADWCLVEVVNPHGDLVLLAAAHVDRQKEAFARRLAHDVPSARDVPRGPQHAFDTGVTEVFPPLDDATWSATPLDPQHPELYRALGVISYMCVPIQFRGQALGVLELLRTGSPARRYGIRELTVAEDFARRAGLALANARLFKDAQDAIRARDEFLQVASHELRTPLTPMQLQLDALERALEKAGVRNGQLSNKLSTMNRQIARLNRLVEALLDVSHIEAGRLPLQLEEFDLVQMVSDTVEHARIELTKAGCSVLVHSTGPVVGRWDHQRLEQIVQNLLANAIKYGPNKPIEITVLENEGTVRIAVTDHGIGIDDEALGRIFGRFERGVSVRNYGGLGLGLYIARQIAEAHGGTIVAQSEPGRGSTFTLILPREHVGSAASEERASANRDGSATGARP